MLLRCNSSWAVVTILNVCNNWLFGLLVFIYSAFRFRPSDPVSRMYVHLLCMASWVKVSSQQYFSLYIKTTLGIWIMSDLNNERSVIQIGPLFRFLLLFRLIQWGLNSKHLNSGNIWITNFYLCAIQMPANSSLFKAWPEYPTKS